MVKRFAVFKPGHQLHHAAHGLSPILRLLRVDRGGSRRLRDNATGSRSGSSGLWSRRRVDEMPDWAGGGEQVNLEQRYAGMQQDIYSETPYQPACLDLTGPEGLGGHAGECLGSQGA